MVATGCGGSGPTTADLPGTTETRRIVETVATATGTPRQESAMDYARAAAATRAGSDGRLLVVAVEEREARELIDPLGLLVFRVQADATACYEADFSWYGVIDSPREVACDPEAQPVEIPPAPPPEPLPDVPVGADAVVRSHLQRLGARPDVAGLESGLVAALPARPGALSPVVEVRASGPDVGVALRGEGDCLLGARVAGKVEVWRPSDVQVQPGELSCDGATALARLGQTPTH